MYTKEQALNRVLDDILRQVVCDCGNFRHHGVGWMPEGSGEGRSVARLILLKWQAEGNSYNGQENCLHNNRWLDCAKCFPASPKDTHTAVDSPLNGPPMGTSHIDDLPFSYDGICYRCRECLAQGTRWTKIIHDSGCKNGPTTYGLLATPEVGSYEIISSEKIELILDRFKFEDVHQVMTALHWVWWDTAPEVPNLEQLRTFAKELLGRVVDQEIEWSESGGFRASRKRGEFGEFYQLEFIVRSSDNEYEN